MKELLTDEQLRDMVENDSNARVVQLSTELLARRIGLTADRAELDAAIDSAYRERNSVVAALAKCFPSGIAKTAIEGWDETWHNCVYIDTPVGQASWHFHDNDADLFAGLPPYHGKWDGHTTPEKYARLAALRAERAKPTQSDEERAREVAGRIVHEAFNSPSLAYPIIAAAFASIRAEGSAERAKLEAAAKLVIYDIHEYEHANNLYPNPGRTECWDSVAELIALLAKPSTPRRSQAVMDDAEIARLRADIKRLITTATPAEEWWASKLVSSLDALEQARKEWDEERARWKTRYQAQSDAAFEAITQRDAAQQDAKEARALLARSKHTISEQYTELHARIEAMLENKL